MDSASALPKDYTYLNHLAKTRELSEQDWERVNLILGQHPLPIQRFYRAVEWLKGKPALPVSSSPPAKTPPLDKNIDFVLYPKKNGKNSTLWSSTDSDPIADMIEWKKKVAGKLNGYHAPYEWKFNEHQDHIHVDNSYYEPPRVHQGEHERYGRFIRDCR